MRKPRKMSASTDDNLVEIPKTTCVTNMKRVYCSAATAWFIMIQ